MNTETLDVVVVGCGISGISTAYHLSRYCPKKTFVVLERRSNLGGTWDLFNYPGIRSDSDMYTFGFSWKNWTSDSIISPKEEILEYLENAVDENDLRRHIRFGTNVLTASYSSSAQRWTVITENRTVYKCQFLVFNTGYYSYENPHTPEFKNRESFRGQFVHPQTWPKGLEYKGKEIVVIGSGATAATMVPALVEGGAAKVTMLQRSPSYFISSPRKKDWFYNMLKPWLGESIAFSVKRWQNIFRQQAVYDVCQMYPRQSKKALMGWIRAQCPEDFDANVHFNPKYNPWDQRLCLCPDGDFFHALKIGQALVVTDHVEEIKENGILTRKGDLLKADIIVSATGLNLQQNFPMSTIQVSVDGRPYVPKEHFGYRGCMLSDIPNFVFTVGYSNAGWTLKADLVSKYVCDLINHCNSRGIGEFCPRADNVSENTGGNILGLQSGYLTRSEDRMPRQGTEHPWVMSEHNVLYDFWRYKVMDFGEELEFRAQVDGGGAGRRGRLTHGRL